MQLNKRTITYRKIQIVIVAIHEIDRPPKPDHDNQSNNKGLRDRMHHQVNNVKKRIIRPCVDIYQEPESFPGKTGYLGGNTSKHHEFMPLRLEVTSFEPAVVKVYQPGPCYENDRHDVPVVLLLTHLPVVI